MNLDNIIKLIAPQQCIACAREGAVLCDVCLQSAGDNIPSRCAGCKSVSINYKTCSSCSSWLNVYAVYVATNYDGIYEKLVRAYKFDVKREAANPIAELMVKSLGNIPSDNIVICPMPTAPLRIRQRGFDHAELLASTLAKQLGQKPKSLLSRKSNVRQLGSSRSKRIEQMKQEFFVRNESDIEGKTILLVDDVMTTGASLSAAALTLRKANANRVYAVVFAQKI